MIWFIKFCKSFIDLIKLFSTRTCSSVRLKSLRLWRWCATETLLSHFMQVRSKLPVQSAASSICEICSALAPCWSWKSSSTWKPSRHHRVASIADSQRAKRGLLTLSLHRRQPRRQLCPTLLGNSGYNLVKDKVIYVWDVQRRGLAIKAKKERKKLS